MAQVKLISPSKEATLRCLLPITDDDSINKLLQSNELIIYTRKEVPLAYQHAGTFKDARFDIGPDEAEKPHNGSREFPWDAPGGAHRCDNVKTFKFLHLPEGKKIVWRQLQMPVINSLSQGRLGSSRTEEVIRWVYPEGTVFGEVLTLVGPDGLDYAFEMRVRRKEGYEWGVDIFRPFPNYKDLLRVLPPDNPVALHLANTQLINFRLVDQRHRTSQAIDVMAGVDVLPDFGDDELVKSLLHGKFYSALNSNWRGSSLAPTTNASFSIVPARYDATFLGTDRASCAKCHESTQQDVSRFQLGRDWYGRIRGSDRILSFTIADPSRLIRDASQGPVMFNPLLRPVLEPYNQLKHQEDYYDTNKDR